MADEIIRMEDIYADDIVGNINEVREARGTFESLDARLDNIDGNAPSPSTSDPAMDGTASPGSADTYSRGDHVHPTDTSRQAVIDSSHKLSSDLVDDTNNTNKFATAAQLQQITTNETNISSILDGATIDSFGDVETALSGKQATLTTAQLAAVNSGIDSTKVAQIETNKNNISKDEAALVEIVDGGAKNRWKITIPATLPTEFTATIDTDGGLILNGKTGSSALTFTTAVQFHAGETVVLSGCPAGGSDESYRIDILRGENTNYCYGDPVIASGFTETTYQVRIRIAANYTCNNLKFFPMVCTLVAWKISQAYQPYRPSYQELYEMVKALQANQ